MCQPNQPPCEKLWAVCWVHCHLNFGGHRCPGVFWCGLPVHPCAYCPCTTGVAWQAGKWPYTSWKDQLQRGWHLDLLSLCQDATYLAFEGKIYQQVHGTAMGSPVSVVVANLIMEDTERKALSTFHTPPLFWRRHVDGTCTALPLDLVDSLHQHLNSVDPNIQFTVEKKDGQLRLGHSPKLGHWWLHQHLCVPPGHTHWSVPGLPVTLFGGTQVGSRQDSGWVGLKASLH